MVYKRFVRELAALVIARAYILGPLERMKIIMQVKELANFTNPADKPKNFWDLSNKISLNQGLFAYFRGSNALVYRLTLTHAMKFSLYETVFQNLKQDGAFVASLGASTFTALLTTAVTYPLDLAHGRMAGDMSKKPSVIAVSKQAPVQ